MRWLLTALPALVCAAMMLLICVPMLFGHRHRRDEQSASKEEVAALREEVDRLRAERTQDLRRDEHV
jgi:hypothetical protein